MYGVVRREVKPRPLMYVPVASSRSRRRTTTRRRRRRRNTCPRCLLIPWYQVSTTWRKVSRDFEIDKFVPHLVRFLCYTGQNTTQYYYCVCHPTMCSMSFNVDHSKTFPKEENSGNDNTPTGILCTGTINRYRVP